MGKISVLHLITDLSTGGAQIALLALLAGLNREQFFPGVACLYGGDTVLANRIHELGVPVTDLEMSAKWRWDAVWRLYGLLRRERPDVLHCWMFHANFLGRILGRWVGVPVIVTSRRNVNIGGGLREFLNRWSSGLDDKVVAVCEAARRTEIERSGVAPSKVVTIYNGVDPDRFAVSDPRAPVRVRKEFGVPLEAPLVGAVGRLHPQKGFTDLLAALAETHRHIPATRLLLVGEGELRCELEAQTQTLGISEAVIFAGPRSDVAEILAGLDVFVLPSLWEGTSNAALEAMAAGLPVVATAVGGTPEVVVDGVTGLLVPPCDAAQLAEAIVTLLHDPAWRRRLGQAGRERVRDRFSVERMVSRTATLYRELLGEDVIRQAAHPGLVG